MQQKLVRTVSNIRSINWGCHGIPERCLDFRGHKMRICARCFGSNIGHIVSFILFVFNLLPHWYIGPLFIVIMLIDWSLQTFGNIPSTNLRRVITGFLGGLGVGIIFWSGVKYLMIYFKIVHLIKWWK